MLSHSSTFFSFNLGSTIFLIRPCQHSCIYFEHIWINRWLNSCHIIYSDTLFTNYLLRPLYSFFMNISFYTQISLYCFNIEFFFILLLPFFQYFHLVSFHLVSFFPVPHIYLNLFPFNASGKYLFYLS